MIDELPPSPDDSTGPTAELLGDARLTATGLMIETFSAIGERIERELESYGLGSSSFEVLVRLARSEGHRLRMTELAAQSTLTNSGLTRVVDRLERQGHVERVPCSTDRRGWFAALTDAGLSKLAEVLPAHLATVSGSFTEVLDPEELDAFLLALRKLRSVVRPGSEPSIAAMIADD